MLAESVQGHDRHAAERAHAEQAEVEHRPVAARLDHPERREHHGRQRERGKDQRRSPPFGVAPDQREDQAEQGEGERDHAAPVDRLRVGGGHVLELGLGEHHRRDPDRDVDEEHPLPAQAFGDGPAHERPDGHGSAEGGAPDADRLAPLAALELLRDERKRSGEHAGSAHALEAAAEVEDRRALGQPAQQRGHGENHEPDGEDPAAAEPVAKRSEHQQERCEGERVGVHHPLEARQARVQIGLYRGERDVHDRHVHEEHERGNADRDERPPLAFHRYWSSRRPVLRSGPAATGGRRERRAAR